MSTNLENIEKNEDTEISKVPFLGVRHIQATLLFFLLAIAYAMRINMSVAIVAMTTANTSKNPDIPVYDWKDQSLVLSSFYWGYFVLQIPAAYLAKTYGPKWFLFAVMSINSVLCLVTPYVADSFGSMGVMGLRVCQGLSQGFLFPSVHTLLSNWAPAQERTIINGVVYGGTTIGIVFSMPITGIISASWYGWPMSYNFFTLLGVLWVIVWFFFGSNKPSQHRSISAEERRYIETSLGHVEEKKHKTPWKSIITSLPFLAIVASAISVGFGNTFLLTETPTYLNKILGFDMSKNSFLSSTPYIAQFFFGLLTSPASDLLINRGICSRVNARKIFNTIGLVLPAISLTILSFLPKDQVTLSVALLIFNGATISGYSSGALVNLLDLSPNHGGILMGIANGSGNVFSIIAPLLVQYIVVDQNDQSLWRIVFILASCLFIVADCIYLMFASGDVQSWNEEGTEEENEIEAQKTEHKY